MAYDRNRYPLFWIERSPEGRWYRTDTGVWFSAAYEHGIGAVYDADVRWKAAARATGLTKSYGDGLYIVVRTPGGDWAVDGPAGSNGKQRACPWTRTGDPRHPAGFSVHPSINFGDDVYHGWVRNGFVEPA